MRDITLEDTFIHPFTTRAFADAVPGTLGGAPVLSVLEGGNVTPITAGVSLSVDRASVAGLNEATIVATSANGYELGKSYSIYISTGTVGGTSVVGEIVGVFTIGSSAAAVDLANGADGLTEIKAAVDAIPTTAMRGTDDAALASVATELRLAELDPANLPADIDALTSIATEARLAELDPANLPTDIAAIPTTAMRGTDGANTVTPPTAEAIADQVWDEILTGGTHNVATSAGRRLRQLEANFVITSGTAQAGTADTITLASGEPSTDDIFAGDRVIIVAGTGVGEHGIVIGYVGSTKVATMSKDWVITVDATSEYELSPADVDVETWQHAVVSVSPTTNLPEVDAKSVSDSTAAADAVTEARLAELDPGNIPADIATAQADLDIITGASGALLDPTATSPQLVDDILDEVNTGAAHNVVNSLGRQIRELQDAQVLHTGGVQAASPLTVTLAADASALDDFYEDTRVVIVGGTGKDQARLAHDYNGTTKVLTIDRAWTTDPDATSDYQIQAQSAVHVHELAPEAVAQVKSEVVDALNVDTYAEPGQVAPPPTNSLVSKMSFLYKWARNLSEQSATERLYYADDGTTVDHKAPVSDDGVTYSDGEVVSGP